VAKQLLPEVAVLVVALVAVLAQTLVALLHQAEMVFQAVAVAVQIFLVLILEMVVQV
jgi:hypothetical protein